VISRQPLRPALKDEDPFVRAIAARALGILGDKDSADALAELVKADKEYLVRIRPG
jgi:HEAT repeat protein